MKRLIYVGAALAVTGCGAGEFAASLPPDGAVFEDAPVAGGLQPDDADAVIAQLNTAEELPGQRDETALRQRDPRPPCRIDDFAYLVSRDEAEIPRDDLPTPYRIFRSGETPPDDYDPSRLNVFLDRSGAVFRMTCG